MKKSAKKAAGRMITTDEINRFCLLAQILNFEKYWACYSFSDGILYSKEVKEEAKKVVDLFTRIYGTKELVATDGRILPADKWEGRQFIQAMNDWIESESLHIDAPFGKLRNRSTRMYYQIVLMQLKEDIIKELRIPLDLAESVTSHENIFQKNTLKWIGKMSERLLYKMTPEFMNEMSETESLVLVADVRRSQDLMTYSHSPEYYQEKMVEFLKKVREILFKNYAIFDQFTGDGFIAYFNEHVCQTFLEDYYKMAVDSCKEILDFSDSFFSDWAKTIRRIPVEEIGLSIGIDCGKVSYRDLDDQFLAIGDACVWATRMCSAGKKGDIILNNIPYQNLTITGKGKKCEEVFSETKTGEKFKAFRLKVSEINYMPQDKQQNSITPTAIQ